jgi:hypothetical protein
MRVEIGFSEIFLDGSSISWQICRIGSRFTALLKNTLAKKMPEARRGSVDFVALQRVTRDMATIDFPDHLFRYWHVMLTFPFYS